MVQGLEYLPSKCEALDSNPSTVKKKKNGPWWIEAAKGNLNIQRVNYMSRIVECYLAFKQK
jgi:hypothetical protein